MAGVGVSRLAIVVVSHLVSEDGEELADEWIDGPFFARDEERAATCFRRE